MDPEPSPGKKGEADSAFSSPTALAARIIRSRSPPGISSVKSSASVRSGQISRLRSESEEDILQQMTATTGVSYSKRKTPEPSSPVPGLTQEQVSSAMAMADNAITTANQLVQETGAVTDRAIKDTTKEAKKHLSTIGSLAYSSRGIAAPSAVDATDSTNASGTAVSNENASVSTRDTSLSSTSRRTLDLKHNDNAFHVVANLVVDRFQSQIPPGATSYTLSHEDLAHLDQMVPTSVRTSFVEAVRFRLANNCPDDSTAHVHQLTRQAKIYGLDREGNDNPLIASLDPSNKTITISNIPPHTVPITPPAESRSLTGFSAATKSSIDAPATVTGAEHRPPLPPGHTSAVAKMEQENREFRAKVEEQQKQLRMQQAQRGPVPSTVPVPNRAGEDGSVAASSVEGWSASAEAHVSSTESLARQQLMAELREASNLMAESVTPEAAQFWRNHVVDLQSRLRALHSGSPAPGNQPRTSATAEELMESNRRLMEKYEAPKEPARPPSQSYPPTNIYPPGQGTDTHEQLQSRSFQPAPGSTSNPPQQPAPERPRQKPSYPGRSLPMVDVVAPADLPGGYHFEAEIEGRRFLATVPQGGVRRGETFSCAMRSLETVGADVPVGRWRDRICDFGSHGLCHPVILNTIFCPFLALGQVMTRLNLDVLGRPKEIKTRNTTWGTMMIVVLFWVAMNFLIFASYDMKLSQHMQITSSDYAALFILNASAVFFLVYGTASTRGVLREKYMIREHRCFDLEDCFCSTFCMPCTICQMARHTASYDHVGSACCSADGIADGSSKNGRVPGNQDGIYMV